ncbi:Ricin B lectin [Actinobacteria bacterium OK074]|nr:Ricin B lectin [Actinobacteria bacterium OK074]
MNAMNTMNAQDTMNAQATGRTQAASRTRSGRSGRSTANPRLGHTTHPRRTRPTRPTRLAALLTTLTALIAGPVALGASVAPASAVTGPAVTDTSYGYTAQLVIGDHDRGCSAVLVDPQWLLTAASCFADDPAVSLDVPAGKPALATTATIGRSDLTTAAGAVREVTELIPRTDRDVVLARLNRAVTNVTPIALSGTAATAGEELKFAGYGRTQTEWAPLNLHTGTLSVDSAAATTAAVTGEDGVAACAGDTGGPVVRTVDGVDQLVALTSQSYQGGCFGIDATVTSTGGIDARVDDLASWVDTAVTTARPLANQGTGRCLAVPGGSTENAAALIQWTCTTGKEQQWHLEKVAGGNNDRYLVRNENSGKCLAMPSASVADGTQAIQWPCSGNAEQVWIHDSIDRLRNLNSDKCLAVPNSSTTIGTKVIQWPCSTNNDQKWTW